MIIVNILFYILLGMFFMGWTFRYQEIVIGILSLIIGVELLLGQVRK